MLLVAPDLGQVRYGRRAAPRGRNCTRTEMQAVFFHTLSAPRVRSVIPSRLCRISGSFPTENRVASLEDELTPSAASAVANSSAIVERSSSADAEPVRGALCVVERRRHPSRGGPCRDLAGDGDGPLPRVVCCGRDLLDQSDLWASVASNSAPVSIHRIAYPSRPCGESQCLAPPKGKIPAAPRTGRTDSRRRPRGCPPPAGARYPGSSPIPGRARRRELSSMARPGATGRGPPSGIDSAPRRGRRRRHRGRVRR